MSDADVRLTPEQIERFRQTGIRLDREGRFWHEGAEITHPGLRRALLRWLDRLEDGRPILRLDERRYAYVDVEDAELLALSARWAGDRVLLVLNDESEEELDCASLEIGAGETFLLLVTVMALVGWARPAMLVRSVVKTGRTRDYVVAARSFGASNVHLVRRHVLPQLRGVALTQAAVLVPQYTLAEVTLSFFGLGVAEPVPSWGNMLASLQRYHVLASYWWMFLPAVALVPVFWLYYVLADKLHQRTAYSL